MRFLLEDIKYKDIISIDRLALPHIGVTCIVGESGSGKTTLLRLLNNLLTPDSGHIWYNNTELTQIDPVLLRRKVVMLPQNPTIFPGTIEENLQIGREFCELPRVIPELLEQALSKTKLPKAISTRAEELSGGEKQRLALARILLLEPETLLLDEPSSALDEQTEQLVVESITSFAREHKLTLIMVTHSKAMAVRFGDTIITIHKGQISEVKRGGNPL